MCGYVNVNHPLVAIGGEGDREYLTYAVESRTRTVA